MSVRPYSTGEFLVRKLQPQAKTRVKTVIPDELRVALVEVRDQLAEAGRNPGESLAYDDAIQAGPVCGGCYGKPARPIVLRYAPSNDRDCGAWDLSLHPTELEDIVDGVLTEMSLYACAGPNCRRRFRDPETHCPDCDYVIDPEYAHLTLEDALPRLASIGIELPASVTRLEVEAALGAPDESGGGKTHRSLGAIRPWIKYRRDDGQLRFEFGGGGQVVGVTFLPRDWTPGS